MRIPGKTWLLLVLVGFLALGTTATVWLLAGHGKASNGRSAPEAAAPPTIRPIPPRDDPERVRAETFPTEQGDLEAGPARQRDVFKAFARRDKEALVRLLKDRIAFQMAANALMGVAREDAGVRDALEEAVREPAFPAHKRAMVLQDLLGNRLLDPDRWIPWAQQSDDWVFRQIGVGKSFDPQVGFPLPKAIVLAIPRLDDSSDAVREMAWTLLKRSTGMNDLPPDARTWESWWRQEGEAWARSRAP